MKNLYLDTGTYCLKTTKTCEMSDDFGFTLDWEEENALTAQNNFTDRDDFREILIDAVETPQSINERRVKVFYGAGGQGKSALKNDFFIRQYLAKHADENLVYADRVDFEEQEKTRFSDEGLLRIAQDLIEKGKIPLPAFCLGFLRYRKMTASEKNLKQDYPFLFKIKFLGNDLVSDLFSHMLNGLLDVIASGSDALPGVGFFTKKIADKGHRKIVEWIQQSDARRVLGDLDELNSSQLLQRLPLLLAYDINKYLKRYTSEETPYPSKRIIIIFDGYETLWRNAKNTDIDNDAWIRTLVEKTPGVLFVIFGRDKLNWANRNMDFEKIIDQHLIKGLSDDDTNEFLEKCGVDDQAIRNQIILSSKPSDTPEDGCLPFYLDLQVKTYQNIKRKGGVPRKEDFTANDDDVIKHFFEHLHDEVASAIKALCLAPYIDEAIIELYVANNFISPSTVSVKSLSRHSFIRFDGNSAIIHGLMKEMAVRQFKGEFSIRYQKINEILFNWFEKSLPTTAVELDATNEQFLSHAAYHKEIIDPAGFLDWAFQKSRFFYGRDIYGSLTSILENALRLFFDIKKKQLGKDSISPEDSSLSELHKVAGIHYYLAERHNQLEQFNEAEKQILECIRTLDLKSPVSAFESLSALKNPTAEEKIQLQEYLIILETRKNACEKAAEILETLDRYLEAGEYYNNAQKLAVDYGFEFDKNAYAGYLVATGRFGEAEPVLFRAYQATLSDKSKNPTDTHINEQFAITAHNLAKMLRSQQRFDEAIPYHEQAIAVYEQTRTSEHEYYAITKAALASTLIDQRLEIDRAEQILNEVFDIYRKKYDEDNLAFGYHFLALSRLYIVKRDLEKAEEFFQKGGQVLSKRIRPNCKGLLEGQMHNSLLTAELFAEGKINSDQYDLALIPLVVPFKYNFDLFKNTFSIYHPIFQRTIQLVADELKRKGNEEDAVRMDGLYREFRRISETRTAIRYSHLNYRTLSQKDAFLSLCRPLMSLPKENNLVTVVEIDLPFLIHYRLYEIIYKNTQLPTYRYVLSDGVKAKLVDYTNTPIYEVMKTDSCLDESNVVDYIRFFFDSVCGRLGFFHSIHKADDISWREDVFISLDLKSIIENSIRSPRILETENNKTTVELFILFKDGLFRTSCAVYTQNIVDDAGKILISKGKCELKDERRCIFLERGAMVLKKGFVDEAGTTYQKYTTLDDEEILLSPDEKTITEIPACIDPDYFDMQQKLDDQPLSKKVLLALQSCRNFAEMALSSDEASNEIFFLNIQEHYQKTQNFLDQLQRGDSIQLADLINLLKDGTKLLEYVTEDQDESSPAEDWRLNPILNEIAGYTMVIGELENLQKNNTDNPS